MSLRLNILAAEKESLWNQYTIMPEDMNQPGSPIFENYPVKIKFHGRIKPLDLGSHPEAKQWQENLLAGSKTGPNFADHMTIIEWSCGTDCTQVAFIDAKSGKVYFDENLKTIIGTNIHDDLYKDGFLRFKRDSKLLIAIGCPNEQCSFHRGITYFLWTGKSLKKIFYVPKGWYVSSHNLK
jgi:hypothetical protein